MGLQDLRKGRDDAASVAASSAGMGQLNAFIDQGSEFSGKLCFRDTVRIDGKFEGEISSDSTLIIGETGEIHATIQSETVVISGKVEGDVIAPRQITVHSAARVKGNLRTASLVVEDGAQVNGKVTMGPDVVKEEREKKARTNGVDKPKAEAAPAT
jgi:cytoskeletal protein CcmA (bactofilin family)